MNNSNIGLCMAEQECRIFNYGHEKKKDILEGRFISSKFYEKIQENIKTLM